MSGIERQPQTASLFPGYFLGGFECSTLVNQRRVRIDELRMTRHDKHVLADYRRLKQCGIRTVRDGIRWNLIDRGGQLDFSSTADYVESAVSEEMTVIWDLFHFGYPEDADPFVDNFTDRFSAYCRSFARRLVLQGIGERGPRAPGVRFYTPINEISFLAWAGGEVGWFAPHVIGRGAELKRVLAAASIRAMDSIREVDPLARFIHCEPITRVHTPHDQPGLAKEVEYFNQVCVYEAWDMLAGRTAPELGGSLTHLDIVGVNYYGVNQWEHQQENSVLSRDDPRRIPFSDLLREVHRRYKAPVVVTETGSTGDDRPTWLNGIMRECWDAVLSGVDLHGVCLYPALGMYDWRTGSYLPMGLWDCTLCGVRVPHRKTLSVIKKWQERLETTQPLIDAPAQEPRLAPAMAAA